MTPFAAAPTLQRRLVIELDVLTDDLAERLIRLRRFESTVEIDGGLDVAVTQQSLHGFVVARTGRLIDQLGEGLVERKFEIDRFLTS